MHNAKTMQSEIGGYLSTVIREHFGKGPTSVFVMVKPPFVVVHLRGFLSPTEKILLKKKEYKRVMEIRQLLIEELKPAICDAFSSATNQKVDEIYSDWHLDSQTAMLVGVMSDPSLASTDFDWQSDSDREELLAEVVKTSRKAEKKPESTKLYWLNDRTLLIERIGLLVEIERELIRTGMIEELKQVKRPLEKRLLMETDFPKLLNREIREIFLDWEFSKDKSYILVLLEQKSQN